MPQELSGGGLSGIIELDTPLTLGDLLLAILLEDIILLLHVQVQLHLDLLAWDLGQLDLGECLDGDLPLQLLELNLARLLVELALGVVHENHRQYEEPGLTYKEFICLNQEAMELENVRLLYLK